MIFQAIRCLTLFSLLIVAGCNSDPQTSQDEQSDPHFLNGRSLASSQDFKGAIEQFEKALISNPRSASAHFELGWLNEEHLKNYAAAIYHYEQHLKLRPDSDYATRAKDRIRSCKMDLVKTEFLAPVSQGLQRDLERLTAENQLLKRQLEGLQNQLAARATTPVQIPSTSYVAPEPIASAPPRVAYTPEPRVSEPRSAPSVAPAAARPRTHTVKAGETITAIAGKYDVKLSVFMAANPRVDPRRLKVGQILTVPKSSQ